MGGKTSELWGKVREGYSDISDDITQKDKVKEKWNKVREKTGIFEKDPPPPPPPAPGAKATQGVGSTQELQKRKGSGSTRKIKRTPLGGGASLT